MIETEVNQPLIDHLIEELESLGLEIGIKLEELDEEKKDYLFFTNVLDQLEKSKIDFCSSYFSLSLEEKEFFQKKLLSLFKDAGIVDSIIREIVNLYYLKERGLLEQKEVASQKEVALENLETLSMKISNYLSTVHYDLIIMNHDKYSQQMDRLMLLGSILEEEESPVEDIDFLKEIMDQLKLSFEEKKGVLLEINRLNGSVYQEEMHLLREQVTPPKEKKEPVVSEKENLKGLDDLLGEIKE